MAGQPDRLRRARGPQQDAGEPPSKACPNLAQRPRHLLSLRSIRQNLNRLIHGLSGVPFFGPRGPRSPPASPLYAARPIICHPKCMTLYASAHHSDTHRTLDRPRTRNGFRPRSVFNSALTVSIVEARPL